MHAVGIFQIKEVKLSRSEKNPFFCSPFPTGYGNLTPKTDVGKLMTILYALVGIPLMLLYMTNIGHILGSSFKYTYSKFCRWVNRESGKFPPSISQSHLRKEGSRALFRKTQRKQARR